MAQQHASDDLLRCPITFELFHDPVLAQDGHTYERQAIEQWIRTNGTSPTTRQLLSIEQLIPNRKVKELVDVFETLLHQKNYQFVLDVDVKKKKGRPLFQTNGKTIYGAEWLIDNTNRPEIVLLKIDGAQAKKQASFYVNLSRHPHIIRTFGFVYDKNNPEQNNTILLLQEYAPEGSLWELLQERWTPPDEKILIYIFLQIIEAMICLASNHVVHGDLACRNVLVFHFDEDQPERNVMKITDFGLSRHSQLYSRAPGAARTTLNIIPIRYAAPEVLSTNATSDIYTEKSDVYSMGVLMWEAYSRGSLPWTNIEHDDDVIRRVRNGDLLPQPSNCSPPFWSIIEQTWSTSPSDRPNFSELKHLLAEQYYRSGWTLQNTNERYDTSVRYDLIERKRNTQRQQEERDRKEAQRQQEEEDRKEAQRQQEEEDRKLAQQYASQEKCKQKERTRSATQADDVRKFHLASTTATAVSNMKGSSTNKPLPDCPRCHRTNQVYPVEGLADRYDQDDDVNAITYDLRHGYDARIANYHRYAADLIPHVYLGLVDYRTAAARTSDRLFRDRADTYVGEKTRFCFFRPGPNSGDYVCDYKH